MSTPSSPARRSSLPAWAWLGVLLVIATVAVYGRGLAGGFVEWDDTQLITNNPILRPGGAGLLAHAWVAPVNGLYAPLTYSLYALIAAITRAAGSPLDPGWFHATSLLLHVTGGLVLFHWLRRLCGRDVPAAFGAAVWLLHPIQAEPVAWASGMNSVLGGVLAIGALALATDGARSSTRRRWPLLIGSAVLAAASLCAKPSGVLLPVMLLAVHRLILRRPWKETLGLAGAWAVVLLPFALIGRTAQAAGMMDAAPPVLARFAVAGHAVGFYLAKVAWPVKLGIDYGLTPGLVLEDRRWAPCLAFALATSIVALALLRRWRWGAGGLIVFVAGIGPVLGFVPFYFQSYSTVADRYAYLSMAGVAIVVAFAASELGIEWTKFRATRWPQVLRWPALALLAALAILTGIQVGVWHDTAALMTQAYAVNPDSIVANGQLGLTAQRAGRFDFAEQAYLKVLSRRPYDSAIRAQYAGVLLRTDRAPAAVTEFLRVVNEQPDNARAFNGLGLAFAASGRDADALPAFGRAAQLDPSLADAPANAGDALVRLGDRSRARAAYTAALRIDPRQARALTGLRRLPTTR